MACWFFFSSRASAKRVHDDTRVGPRAIFESMLRTLSALYILVSCGAAAKAPITHEAMWLMKRVEAPAPSPSGKWVVFSLVEPAYDEKDQVSHLCFAKVTQAA
jgi:hypothetical protein